MRIDLLQMKSCQAERRQGRTTAWDLHPKSMRHNHCLPNISGNQRLLKEVLSWLGRLCVASSTQTDNLLFLRRLCSASERHAGP